jgi:hypothetical protein
MEIPESIPGRAYTVAGVVGLAFVLCGVASAQYGLYVVGTPDSTPEVPAAVEAKPYVDGVLLRYTWANLEPAEGQFAWSELDNEIQTAASLGKKVSFAIGAGYFTPAWVYTAGARSFSFIWSGASGPPLPCTSQQIPIPWDSVYSAKWSAFVSALGQRYDGNSAVSWVHVAGVNSLTDETFLPLAQGSAINVTVKGVPYSCNANNDVQNWIKAGYTRTLAENAWKNVDQAFAAAFPHHQLGPMVEPGGFPPIDENGNMIKGEAQDWQVPTDMLTNEHQTWGSRFFAQNNGLSAFWSWQLPSSLAGKVTVAYQMLAGATGDSTCRMNNGVSPCDPATVLGKAIDNGIDNGARYLEIYRSDIENPDLQALLESTQKRLRPSEQLRWHIRP